MSISIPAFSSVNSTFDGASTPKLTPKATETERIRQLASVGHSTAQIARSIGSPETVVAEDLGTTSTNNTSSLTRWASSLLALGTRLSILA